MQLFEDKEHVVSMKEGNFLAFNFLFHKYSSSLYAFVLSITRNTFYAEEITHIVFIKVWEKRAAIQEDFSFKSFLFSIAYNETISWLRKEKSEKRRINGYANKSETWNHETGHAVEYSDLDGLISKLIEGMPEKRRKVYRLSRNQGLTNKQIAQNLKISIKTVENQMTLALRYLKEALLKYDVLLVIWLTWCVDSF